MQRIEEIALLGAQGLAQTSFNYMQWSALAPAYVL